MERRRPRNHPQRPLVLIVDGHDDTRELYALGLSAFGFEAMPVGDETQAYTRAWETFPDIIVTDLPMQESDAWGFLQQLKEDPHTRDIPVVVVSGYAQPSVREHVERDGFAVFFSKPCPPDVLAQGLRQVLAGNRASQAPHGLPETAPHV